MEQQGNMECKETVQTVYINFWTSCARNSDLNLDFFFFCLCVCINFVNNILLWCWVALAM